MFSTKTLALSALAVSASALALTAAPVQAEDLSGTRIGVHADYLWANVSPSGFSDAGTTPLKIYDTNEGGFGVDVRHDWQNGDMVYGVFGSMTWVSAAGGASVAKTVTTEGTTVTEHHGFDTDLSWLAAVGGRVGTVVNENTLLYLQAGLASGKVKISETGDNATAVRDVSKSGFISGVGADMQMNEHWSLGFSISHYDLGKVDFTPAAYAEGKLAVKGSQANVTLGYRF